jgi:hypothetical protein
MTKYHLTSTNTNYEGTTMLVKVAIKARWDAPHLTAIRDPIEELDLSPNRNFCIDLKSLKTDLLEGQYDALVEVDCALAHDGTVIDIYQKLKSRVSVKGGRFVRSTIDDVCREWVAIDPHHYFLETIAPKDSKAVKIWFGS